MNITINYGTITKQITHSFGCLKKMSKNFCPSLYNPTDQHQCPTQDSTPWAPWCPIPGVLYTPADSPLCRIPASCFHHNASISILVTNYVITESFWEVDPLVCLPSATHWTEASSPCPAMDAPIVVSSSGPLPYCLRWDPTWHLLHGVLRQISAPTVWLRYGECGRIAVGKWRRWEIQLPLLSHIGAVIEMYTL